MRQVSPLTALFREGLVPNDRNSFLGLYGILKSVKTYFLYRGWTGNEPALGYLTLAEISVDGQVVPYILSVEGKTVSDADKKLYARMTASQYASGKMLVRGGDDSEVGVATTVTMPENWARLNAYQIQKLKSTKDAKSAYAKAKLENAKLIDLGFETLPRVRQESGRRAYQVVPFAKLDGFHRAELVSVINPNNLAELRTIANVNNAMVRMAARISAGATASPQDLKPPRQMTEESQSFLIGPREFTMISQLFGLSATQVLRKWPLNNAIAQLESLPPRELAKLFGTIEAHKLMSEFREKLAGSRGSVEDQLLQRYYWLGLPQSQAAIESPVTACDKSIAGDEANAR